VRAPPYRVARIITRLNIGGPSIQAILLSRDLGIDGFATRLLHGRLSEGEGDMTSILPLEGIDAVYLDELVRPISPLSDIRACWRLYRALCQWTPDIVHTHMAKAGSLGRVAALAYTFTRGRQRPARLVHTYHGHVFEGYFGTFSTKVFLSIERWLAAYTDTLIAISPRVKDDLLHAYKVAADEQVRVIPLGFDLDRFLAIDGSVKRNARTGLAISEDSIVVSTVGRLSAIKQHSLYLEMAARLAPRSDRFVFLIVGDGELRNQLETQTKALGLETRVQFLGWRGDLEHIYGATDVFVLTSRNEGTPVALIEAMASGVASVSTDVGGVRDVITNPDLGRIVPFGDPVALADEVESLAADPESRARIGTLARLSVQRRFHAKRLLDDIRALYCEILGIGSTIAQTRR
jgi:glycosyltransferase involved in cell wall biosynthesis